MMPRSKAAPSAEEMRFWRVSDLRTRMLPNSEDADSVDFGRNPNRHVAFGGGVHRCLGSHLARQELRVALGEWHRRIPEYSLPEGFVPEYSEGLRSVRNLTLEFPS